MIRKQKRSNALLYLTGDLLATLAAFFLAWFLRFEVGIPEVTKGVPDFGRYLGVLPILLIVWPVVFYFHGLYQSRRDRSRVDEALTIMLAVFFATFLISALQAWYRPTLTEGSDKIFTYSRAFIGIFVLMDLVLVVASRVATRYWLQRRRLAGHNLQRILVVGAGNLGKEITAKLQAHRELGFEVVGFLDDDPGKAGRSFFDVPVLGTSREAERILDEYRIDQVYVALPLEAHRKMMRITESVSRHCVDVKLVPDVLQYATLNASLEDLDGTPVINLSQVPLQGWSSLAKRAMDIAIASAALLVLLPFFPLLALLIWREDRGPIFYRQERMGLDGTSFLILKFRSMRVDAESTTGPVWAIRGDGRRTDIGSFMRQWSIDELPQLWNVLKGEMSIIGPRPERPTFVHEFKHKIPDYMLRHRVKAGITGWAQVHGWRGNTSIKKRIQYDLYYIQNWSLLLDLKILWMTLRSGIWHNAY
ncbi:MAG: undecaprenyl-phosphate glucose phosphotransferase [Holophagales bacterium]|nr:undecaprenyl-phosphate glucose phosphotransferase [Holophagales bacterium]